MSRLIVKNLPNGMKEERFRKMFAAFGTLTDCSLKFTKDGKFRKFGFVGFKLEEDAEKARKHFDRSFVDTSRVTVEPCKSFGDPSKDRPWSKHSRQQANAEEDKEDGKAFKESQENKEKKKKNRVSTVLGDLEKDQGFQEFLAVHQNRSQVPTWANDSLEESAFSGRMTETSKKDGKKPKKTDDYLNFDSDQSVETSDEEEQQQQEEEEDDAPKRALKTGLSDMDYLRSKMVEKSNLVDDSDEDDVDEEPEEKEGGDAAEEQQQEEEEEGEEQENIHAQQDSAYDSGDVDKTASSANRPHVEPSTAFTVKLRGVPFRVTEQQIREFMMPLKPVAIRIAKISNGLNSGYVYVDLRSEQEIERALRMNKDYMGGRYIEVFRERNQEKVGRKSAWQERNFQRELKEDEEEEDVSESGRLFIRNLPYTCTEEELSELFSKHGPVSEMNFPIDSLTKTPKGFAFVTYMIPENAVEALAKLDGHVFQGRMLHILPSRMKKERSEEGSSAPGSSSFKRQKEAKDKATSSSSHNWNALFLGTSSVADAIAEKYNTTKSQVLDHESQGSVAVRMALGETQIVQETRQFLLDNGVSLDSFSQAAGARSNSVILVKNLPSGVQVSELETLFSPFGSLGRVLLPPSGLTAIVEFLEPTEAKRAFTRLAYSKFQHVPLYLEWAPTAVFSTPAQISTTKPPAETQAGNEAVVKQAAEEEEEEEENEEDEEDESVPGAMLFVKNLNFSTTEETLRQTFSKCGEIKSCSISSKRDKTGKLLSMGYGFVEYKKADGAQKALRQLQHCKVDEHQLEIKLSERATKACVVSHRKKQTAKKQTTSKILVRNIPFQATVKEVRELFCTFGELKTVRMPKKASGTGSHRGFGFVDFLTKQDAKKAFKALCHSTHLYGRRLVLEWADTEESVDALRRKTAQHFHDAPKKRKQSEMLEGILQQMEAGEGKDE
ncbi:putative RNA-binding protein 19 [Denticeps clupeoides]|uniref:Probable RNA-binding protein 19 n=1 Tax=Denticeps clupeoides TaxID=299321 RepID=A0AAY4C359_9TELE|nr:probable RNA-binding protein 19 [Denticeps clupeoides]